MPIGRAPYKAAKGGVGTISGVGTFNHARVPMSCLQCLDGLKTTVEPPAALKSSPDGTQHSECHHDNREHGVPRSTHCISYVVYGRCFVVLHEVFTSDMHKTLRKARSRVGTHSSKL